MLWNGLALMEMWSVSEPIDGNEVHVFCFKARFIHKLWADIARIAQQLHFVAHCHNKRKNAVSHNVLTKCCLLLSLFNNHVSKIELLFQNQSHRSFKFGVVIQRRKGSVYIFRNICKIGFHFIFYQKLNNLFIKIHPHFLVWNMVHMGLRVVIVPLLIFSEVAVKIQEVKQGLLRILIWGIDERLNPLPISVSCEQFKDIRIMMKF